MKRLRIEIAPTALAALRRVRDKKVRRELVGAIDGLASDPRAGKPLAPPLEDLLSVRACGERWRILYRVEGRRIQVAFVGRRRPGEEADVYALAARWVRLLRG